LLCIGADVHEKLFDVIELLICILADWNLRRCGKYAGQSHRFPFCWGNKLKWYMATVAKKRKPAVYGADIVEPDCKFFNGKIFWKLKKVNKL
jgi:hypothetical protein